MDCWFVFFVCFVSFRFEFGLVSDIQSKTRKREIRIDVRIDFEKTSIVDIKGQERKASSKEYVEKAWKLVGEPVCGISSPLQKMAICSFDATDLLLTRVRNIVKLYIWNGWRGFGFDVVTINTLVGWRLSGGARKKFSRENQSQPRDRCGSNFTGGFCGWDVVVEFLRSLLPQISSLLQVTLQRTDDWMQLMKEGRIHFYSPFLICTLYKHAWRAHAVPMWPISRFNGSIQEYFRVFVWRKRLTTNFSQPLQDSDAS